MDVLIWKGIIKTASFIIVSPLIGLILGLCLMVVVLNLSRHSNVNRSNLIFKKLQLFSAAIYSISHGMNDAQKTMGIIALVLYSGGYLGPNFHIPFWVVIALHRPGPGNHVRVVADREDDGNQDYQASAHGRLLRGNGGGVPLSAPSPASP